MRIGITSDWHICQYSSIVRSNSAKYSVRLDHLIDSINWAEDLFARNGCDAHICLGDAFDKSTLNATEISALCDIRWAGIEHYFIVGNHELESFSLDTNTANLFALLPCCSVISKPTWLYDGIFILPYILEKDRKPLEEYLKIYDRKPILILSHNDIAGIQYGKYVSEFGFPVDQIENSCDLFLNGHLHNMGQICKNGWNVGNLCGQNFSEDAFTYRHCAWIIDTDTREIETFENPYALNFYKLDFRNASLEDIDREISELPNAVCSIQCFSDAYDYVSEILSSHSNIVTFKISIPPEDSQKGSTVSADELTVDHLKQFKEYVVEHMGSADLIMSELQEVLK